MSSLIRFNQGRTFLLDGREVSVVRVINGDLVTLEDITSLVIYQHTKQQLLELWASGRIVPKPVTTPSLEVEQNNTQLDTLDSYPQKLIDDALRRKKYLDMLATLGEKIVFTPAKLKPLLTYIAQQLGDPEAPSTITIYRWFKRKLQHKDHPLALLEKPHTRGWFGCRFPTEVQETLIELIETRYLESPGCSIVDLRDALHAQIHALNQLRTADSLLPLPSYDTIRRATLAYPAYVRAVAKFGKQEASIRFRTSLTKQLQCLRPWRSTSQSRCR